MASNGFPGDIICLLRNGWPMVILEGNILEYRPSTTPLRPSK